MRKELDKLLDLQDKYVKQVILCYDEELISTGRAKELLGFDDITDLRDFIASKVSIDKFKSKLWIEKNLDVPSP